MIAGDTDAYISNKSKMLQCFDFLVSNEKVTRPSSKCLTDDAVFRCHSLFTIYNYTVGNDVSDHNMIVLHVKSPRKSCKHLSISKPCTDYVKVNDEIKLLLNKATSYDN